MKKENESSTTHQDMLDVFEVRGQGDRNKVADTRKAGCITTTLLWNMLDLKISALR